MPFFNSKSVKKEQIKHTFYYETGMNEMCSIDLQILIRFQCWLEFNTVVPNLF